MLRSDWNDIIHELVSVSTQARGTLKAGLTGGASNDTEDADNGLNYLDIARIVQLYDPLININTAGLMELQLAESIEPNTDATKWTVRIRPDVEFHNGKTLTAEDVIFTLRRIINPKLALVGGVTLNAVDGANIRALDSRTVSIPCHTPFSTLPEALTDYNCYIVPVDYNPQRPIGTGAFRWESFTPGVESVYVRNPNYWQAGLPYVDKLIISDYPETTSQVNALASGEVDYVDQLPASAVAQARAGGATIVVSTGGAFNPFVMRVDRPPFNDVRVRQAFRYIVDRQQMRTLVYGGHGDLGNDLFAITDPQYNHEIPQRAQDLDRARSLLKSAGHESLTVQLITSPIAGGVTEAAAVFAQQASLAGVKVTLQQIPNSTFFGPAYTTRVFTQDDWMYTPYFAQVAWSMVPGAPINETHFDNARYNSLYAEALKTTDTARKTDIVHEMQLIEWDTGGYIIPVFSPFLDAHSPRLHGITGSRMGMPSWAYAFKTCWFGT